VRTRATELRMDPAVKQRDDGGAEFTNTEYIASAPNYIMVAK